MYSKILAGLISLSVIPLSALASSNFMFKIKNAKVFKSIEETTAYLIKSWEADEEIKIKPPQVIPIAKGSTVYGGCGTYVTGDDVGGSSYCPASHTIFLVPEQLKAFETEFGQSAVAYVVAHEFGHAVQRAYDVWLPTPNHELQADCLAGIFIKEGTEQLGITREDTIAMSNVAYAIGDPTHGTGEQRAYALASGMGVIEGSCEPKQMEKLAEGKIDLANFATTRSISKSVDLSATPYPKNVLGSMGL